ncbi:MAG: hypothetical protein IPK76_04680 [Lewinellaceae bacterium]|nr:hypothetical protein [Lewinellaceae bacterium]
MELQEIIKKIEGLLAEGQTEEALNALMEFTKSSNSPQHEDVVLLSGQFRQWKRENMLGVEQTNSELHRIEMGILTILKGGDILESSAGDTPSDTPAGRNNSGIGSIKQMAPIIGGVLGLIAVIVVVWSLTSGKNDSQKSLNAPVVTQSVSSVNFSVLPVRAGVDLVAGQKYLTADQRHYMTFQEDGNLCIYRSSDDSFVWGSIQVGAPADGKAARMQKDGNLVILDGNSNWMWGTQTTDPSAFLGVTNDGALAVINASNQVIWKK